MTREAMLSVKSLGIRYDAAIAVDGASFNIDEGELVCIVGANGAGKTSTIRGISGMAAAHAGEILWRGKDIRGLPPWDICELGIIQVAEGRQLFPSLSVGENLMLGGALKRARHHRKRNLGRVHALFPRIRERWGQKAGTLSGGEQQMLAIGRGMMAEPELLMLDEPSIGLSPALTKSILEAIGQLRAEGTTILLVEQNVAESLRIADRAYVLENGRMVFDGNAGEVLRDEGVKRAYLGL